MSWAGLASNQTISFNNLQNAVNTGVFTLKNSIPASTEQITKSDADFYVNIDTSYGPYAAKASNQLVVKSDLQSAASYYTYRLYGFGYSNASDACTNQSFDSYSDVYAAQGTLATVTRFFSDTSLITPVVGGSQWYAFTAGGTSSPVYRAIVSNGGFLSSSGSC
jgi:hypothetical protein